MYFSHTNNRKSVITVIIAELAVAAVSDRPVRYSNYTCKKSTTMQLWWIVLPMVLWTLYLLYWRHGVRVLDGGFHVSDIEMTSPRATTTIVDSNNSWVYHCIMYILRHVAWPILGHYWSWDFILPQILAFTIFSWEPVGRVWMRSQKKHCHFHL